MPLPRIDILWNETGRQDFVYQMNRLTKSFGKGVSIRPVLKNVNLSFYPGAKIGVLGANGSGKSTLMKVGTAQDLVRLAYKLRGAFEGLSRAFREPFEKPFESFGYTWYIN